MCSNLEIRLCVFFGMKRRALLTVLVNKDTETVYF